LIGLDAKIHPEYIGLNSVFRHYSWSKLISVYPNPLGVS
jgi:hypothetical protein